jgi:hypothetical protein
MGDSENFGPWVGTGAVVGVAAAAVAAVVAVGIKVVAVGTTAVAWGAVGAVVGVAVAGVQAANKAAPAVRVAPSKNLRRVIFLRIAYISFFHNFLELIWHNDCLVNSAILKELINGDITFLSLIERFLIYRRFASW